MSDVFISYAHSTVDQAEQVAQALRALGYGVWRDDQLPAHRAYTDVIEERLEAAGAVVVLWSRDAARSDWVRAEADLARNKSKLVQLVFDGTMPPLPFNQTQCADLEGWQGDTRHPEWLKVVGAVEELVGRSSRSAHQGHRARPVEQTAIAVLPFVNMSSDPEQEYFSDGLSEELINQLSQIKRLRLVGRTSSFAFKGRSEDLRAIGDQLGASHVLEGSVRRAGQRLRITAQLVSCADGLHVWSERFDRELTDVFAIQDEIAGAVAKALSIRLGADGPVRQEGGTENVEAYDLMLRARALIRRRERGDAGHAVTLLREALALDPNFAMAWYFLGNALTSVWTWNPPDPAAVRRQIDEALEHCSRIAPDLWTAHEARANRLELGHDWVAAEKANERSRALAPTSMREPVLSRAHQLAIVGRLTEGVEFARESVRIEPMASNIALQNLLMLAGRFDEAEAAYRRGQDLPKDPHIPHFQAMTAALAIGDKVRAKELLAICVEADQNPFLPQMLAVFDDPERARALTRSSMEAFLTTWEGAQVATTFSFFSAWLGDHEMALAAWRKIARYLIGVGFMQMWHPIYADMRRLPGFKDLVREANILTYWRETGQWGEFARPLGPDDFEVYR